MMVIMTHPLHGRLAVYSPSEVESNKVAGWIIEEDAPETKYVEPVPGIAPSVSEHEPAAPEPTPEPAPTPAPAAKSALKSFLAGLSEDEV